MKRPVFYLSPKQANYAAIVVCIIISIIVAYALSFGDVRGFNQTYLTN
ncbi:hypothetical protein [Sphingobacterium mizutaii]|nr:hypothetical protein [Sphingobacterium mizutaii]